MAGSVFVEAN